MTQDRKRSYDSFIALKKSFVDDKQLKQEVEWLLRLGLENYNPTERSNRWVVGSIVEWALALALFQASVVSLPEGHNANGHDLIDLRDSARGLWSVKSSFQGKPSDFTITNGLGGPGSGLVDVTVFLHPKLDGIVYVDPEIHKELPKAVVSNGGESRLPFKYLKKHADENPECVIPLRMPENKETNFHGDPGLEAVKLLTKSGVFNRLNRPFEIVEAQAGDLVSQLKSINSMVENGELTRVQADLAINQLLDGI